MKGFFFTFLLLTSTFSFGQISLKNIKSNWSNSLSIGVSYQNGYVFPTNDFLSGTNAEADTISDIQAFSIKFSKQTIGEKEWEQIYKYPDYGIGLYMADFHNPEEIGFPFGIYGFFHAPFKRWEKLSFNYEIGFGATFNWRSFNPLTNSYNTSIGAGQSFLIDAGLDLQYLVTDRLRVQTGFSLTHFSNGALKSPNKGINSIAPRILISYRFFDNPVFIEKEIPKYNKNGEWIISGFGGSKNVIFNNVDIDILEKYEGVNFPIFGLATAYNRQLSYKSKVGVGMSFTYDGSINAQVAVDNNELEAIDRPIQDQLQISIYPSYELVVHQLSLILQPSFYLYRKKLRNQTPVFFQRIGLRYYVKDNLFVGITLRDYSFHVSDFIEWHIGYSIRTN